MMHELPHALRDSRVFVVSARNYGRNLQGIPALVEGRQHNFEMESCVEYVIHSAIARRPMTPYTMHKQRQIQQA